MRKVLLVFLLTLIIFNIQLFAQSAGDYRTKQNGAWATAANWEVFDGTTWITAATAPNSTNGEITVNHAMTIGATITLDQVIVSSTGSISVSGTPTITIADGTGTDFVNNGTVDFANGPFTINGQLVNNASISATIGTLTVGATGTLTNSSTGTMNIGPLTNNGTITNNGAITTNGAVNSSAATSSITNNGTWNINSTFTMNNASSNFTNNGTLNINSTGSYTLTNGSFNNNAGGTVSNNGTVTLNGGTFTNSGTYNNNNLFINNLMTLTLTSPITNAINSTFRYSRNGDQTVYEIPYYHLEIGGSAGTNNKTLTLTSNYSLSGDLTLLASAFNCVFIINGAYNFNIIGTTTINANGRLQPSPTTIIQSSNVININNLGEIRVTNTSSTPLSTQYQNFSSWNVQDSGIVNYFAPGSQIIQETLPDGSDYGNLYISSPGAALNKSLTLTSNRTVRGNLIINSTTAGGFMQFLGNGIISVGGRLDITNNGLTHVEPTVTFNATGSNSYMNIGANTQIRITQNSFTSQYQNFQFVSCASNSTQIFYSTGAQLVEALPTDGPLRPYGNLRLSMNRGSNNITFQSTNIGIQGALIDSTMMTTGTLIFGTSNIIFLNTVAVTSSCIFKPQFTFYDLTFSGTATHAFNRGVKVLNDLTINSGAYLTVNSNIPIALEVMGNTNIAQSVPVATPKISLSTFVYKSKLNNVILLGTGDMTAINANSPYVQILIAGDVLNNNSGANTFLGGTTSTITFVSTSTTKTIGGTNPVRIARNAKVYGPWQLTNHLELNSATKSTFILNDASLNLNIYNLISSGSGAPHILEYLPSNVSMPPATHPFCTHSQVVNWNCVSAETIYVSTTGNNSNSGLSWATALRDMRVAVNRVAHGGVIMVADGTYEEIFAIRKKIKIHGTSNTNTIFQAPSGLSSPVNPGSSYITCSTISQMNDSAIVYFDFNSDSSMLYNVRVNHDVNRIRVGIVIGPAQPGSISTSGIIIDNCQIVGSNSSFFLPTYYDCPYYTYGTGINSRIYNIFAYPNSTFDIRNNTISGLAHRNIGADRNSRPFDFSYIRNNTIDNTTPFSLGLQAIRPTETTNLIIENNIVNGTSIDQGIDIAGGRNFLPADTGLVLVKNNTVNITHKLFSGKPVQINVEDMHNLVKVKVENNQIYTKNSSSNVAGLRIVTSRLVDVLNNTFHAPSSDPFNHIILDNTSGFVAPVGARIFGNDFKGLSLYNSNTIAIDAQRSDLTNPNAQYYQLELNGSLYGYPDNKFANTLGCFLHTARNLGTNVDTIDMTGGNDFNLGGAFDLYSVEERIVHRMDDPRGASSSSYPRPMVFVRPRNYFVCNENYMVGSLNSRNPLPVDNRSIQDGIDFASNHDTINVQKGTFVYPSGTEFENIVNFYKPLSFRSNNNPLPSSGEPIIDRYIQVNLPSANDSVTQYNNFTFSDGYIENLTFDVNQGDWVLNGGVIRFANANATLVEALNHTIRGYTGWIQTTRNIGAPSNLNVAGFGAELTSAVNMGTTTIRRGHWEQTVPAGRSILRVFNIVPNINSGLNATFRFHYDPSELVAGQNPADLQQYRSPNNYSPWHNNYNISGYTLQGGTANTNYVDFSGISAFSSWTLADPTILPVELVTFNATLVNRNSVRLDWFVQNEKDLSHYEIEKSYDLTSFNKIGDNISATGQVSYLSWDYEPKLGVNYYRLKMVDFDGSYKYSEVRTVVIDPTQELSLLVYPNPFNDNLQISLSGVENVPCDIYITDAIGKLVFTQHVPEWKGNTSIDLTKLSSGIYYLKLQAGDKTIGTKLIKN